MAAGTKATRAEDAYMRLREEIRTGVLSPGYQATEAEVALHLGISRTPAREVLIRLEADGLVELRPRHGVRVRPISPDDMREIYEILSLLEPAAAAQLAARKPTQQELAPLVDATQEMEAALEAEELDRWGDADEQFHRTLLQLQGNRRLQQIVSSLLDQANRARNVTMRMRGAPRESTGEHREIVEHLMNGDVEKTRSTFEHHRRRAAREMISLLEKYKLNQL